jgi:hypothetical protein
MDFKEIEEKLIKERERQENIPKEGFWWSKYQTQFPMPIPNQITEEEAKEIYRLIKLKEEDESVTRLVYRGLSHSRIDRSFLGCEEYFSDEFRWPGDFAEHYVLKHKVKPSDAFLAYIGYKK